MKINDKLLKPLTEVSYLRADNVERYRVIIRYFYHEYEKINYMLYRDDIYKMMLSTEYFPDYTIELCDSDLQALENWGNLIATQDTSKVTTLEEFRNRKFRYQLSEYTIEIERMTQHLETLEIEGSSLEPSLLERIRLNIEKMPSLIYEDAIKVHGWWNDVNSDFIRLNRSYQDYIRTLNGIDAEEMMKSSEFVIFKERIINYLRSFVKNLQVEGVVLEAYLKNLDPEVITQLFNKVIEYEASIPRIDRTFNSITFQEILQGRWHNIYNWFVSTTEDSEINRMSEITLEIIRKITRYAQQIGEFYYKGSNRKEEYRQIAQVFGICESLEEAHKMSAMVFGVETCLSLRNLKNPSSDNLDKEVYNEPANFLNREIRSRAQSVRKERIPATNYNLEKEIQKQSIVNQERQRKIMIQSYMNNLVIDFSQLPPINSQSRSILLGWLSKGLADKDLKARTQWGDYFSVDTTDKTNIILKSDDGDLHMPAYKLVFESEIII